MRIDVFRVVNRTRERLDVIPVNAPDDPGRMLIHATFYVWKKARYYSLPAWLEALEILRRARNDYEDEDRIEFGRILEEQERAAAQNVEPSDDMRCSLLVLVQRCFGPRAA
jgi:hypothetical protein